MRIKITNPALGILILLFDGDHVKLNVPGIWRIGFIWLHDICNALFIMY